MGIVKCDRNVFSGNRFQNPLKIRSLQYGQILGKRHISILSTRNVIWSLGVGAGGGLVPMTSLGEELWKISIACFNILKSSIQSIQSSEFS